MQGPPRRHSNRDARWITAAGALRPGRTRARRAAGTATPDRQADAQAARAAEELRLTAKDLKHEGIVDQVIDEPKGGAQNSYDEAARLLDVVLSARLAESSTHSVEERLTRRYQKLRHLGKWGTSDASLT